MICSWTLHPCTPLLVSGPRWSISMSSWAQVAGAWRRSHSSRSTMIAPYDGRAARTSSRSKRVPCARKREHSRACWPGWSRHAGLHSGHPQPGHVLTWPRTSRAQHTRHTGTHTLALSSDCHILILYGNILLYIVIYLIFIHVSRECECCLVWSCCPARGRQVCLPARCPRPRCARWPPAAARTGARAPRGTWRGYLAGRGYLAEVLGWAGAPRGTWGAADAG